MFLSTVNASLGQSTFIIVCLSARTFLGLVGEADPPPICILPILARSASAHHCLFLQGVSQHLGLLAKPWVFRSDLEGPTFDFWCPQFYGGVSEVSGKVYSVLPKFSWGGLMFDFSGLFRAMCWGFIPVWSSWWYPLLLPGWYFPLTNHLSAVSLGFSFTCSLGSPKLS